MVPVDDLPIVEQVGLKAGLASLAHGSYPAAEILDFERIHPFACWLSESHQSGLFEREDFGQAFSILYDVSACFPRDMRYLLRERGVGPVRFSAVSDNDFLASSRFGRLIAVMASFISASIRAFRSAFEEASCGLRYRDVSTSRCENLLELKALPTFTLTCESAGGTPVSRGTSLGSLLKVGIVGPLIDLIKEPALDTGRDMLRGLDSRLSLTKRCRTCAELLFAGTRRFVAAPGRAPSLEKLAALGIRGFVGVAANGKNLR